MHPTVVSVLSFFWDCHEYFSQYVDVRTKDNLFAVLHWEIFLNWWIILCGSLAQKGEPWLILVLKYWTLGGCSFHTQLWHPYLSPINLSTLCYFHILLSLTLSKLFLTSVSIKYQIHIHVLNTGGQWRHCKQDKGWN